MGDTLVLAARTALALACVVGLIWVIARRAGWGKANRRATGPAVAVVGRQALGRHAGVAVLAVGERRLLVGFGEQQITMLTELEPVAEVDEPEVVPTPRAAKPLISWRKRPAGDFESTLAAAVSESESSPVPEPAATPATAAALAAANSALNSAARLLPTQGERTTAVTPGEHTTVPGLAGARVVDIDPADLTTPTEPVAAAGGALDGSILAPSTWRQAVTALRERTVRR